MTKDPTYSKKQIAESAAALRKIYVAIPQHRRPLYTHLFQNISLCLNAFHTIAPEHQPNPKGSDNA